MFFYPDEEDIAYVHFANCWASVAHRGKGPEWLAISGFGFHGSKPSLLHYGQPLTITSIGNGLPRDSTSNLYCL